MSSIKNLMEYKGFKAQIMEAERLTGNYNHGLPLGNPLDVYPSDVFVEYPEQWMKGPGVFVAPVRANKGLWFNFRMNSEVNTAVVPTIKGCNPITGLPTSGLQLEKYENKCPKHNIKFKGDRYCEECGYKWPAQNYISGSPLWIDGFRSEDGSVRQFFFTEDEIRDVATHMIGKDSTVPAFGFAFYQPKEMRAETIVDNRYSETYSGPYTMWGYPYSYKLYDSYLHTNSAWGINVSNRSGTEAYYNGNLLNKDMPISYTSSSSSAPLTSFNNPNLLSKEEFTCCSGGDPIEDIEVSVGAGAKISQTLALDPYALDTWRDKPSASMVIYFVFESKLKQMLSKGVKDLEGKKEGMLDSIPVG